MTPPKRKVVPRRLRFQTQKSMDEAVAAGGGEPTLVAEASRSAPRIDAAASQWKADVARAGSAWPELTVADLSILESRERSLLSLLQTRYGISEAEADRQITSFAADRQTATLWAGDRESRSPGPHQLAPMRPPAGASPEASPTDPLTPLD
ncbi:MAG: hypothetical protein ABI672_17165 [Vicinamibacteria bacterium]